MKFSLFYIFFLITNIALSQIIIFEENFQNPNSLSNWKLINDNNIPHPAVSLYDQAWITIQDPANNLDTVASATSYFETDTKANRWMISPEIPLGSYGNFLSWNARSFDPSFPDDYLILISTTNNSKESFEDTLAIHILEDYRWTNFDLSLSELGYNNKNIFIAFVLNSIAGNRIFIDDIIIRKEDALSTQHTKIDKTILKSTIVNEGIEFSTNDFINGTVYSISGKEICRFNSSNFKELNEINKIETGSYFIHFLTINGVKIERFIKI
jgi:hypothetical protein